VYAPDFRISAQEALEAMASADCDAELHEKGLVDAPCNDIGCLCSAPGASEGPGASWLGLASLGALALARAARSRGAARGFTAGPGRRDATLAP
jgi:hypothetical protein